MWTRNSSPGWRVALALMFALHIGQALAQAQARALTQLAFTFAGVTYPYWVFTPSAFRNGAQLPVLLLLHGAGGKGEHMLNLWQDFAEQKGIILVAPTFPLDAKFETQVPQLLPQFMNEVKTTWHFDPKRVYVFGYSAGGYITFDAATLCSDDFAAAGVFADIISPDYEWIVTKARRKTPIAIYIGDSDPAFTLAQTRHTRDLLESHGFPVHYVEVPHQNHNYGAASATVNPDVWNFMSQYKLP